MVLREKKEELHDRWTHVAAQNLACFDCLFLRFRGGDCEN